MWFFGLIPSSNNGALREVNQRFWNTTRILYGLRKVAWEKGVGKAKNAMNISFKKVNKISHLLFNIHKSVLYYLCEDPNESGDLENIIENMRRRVSRYKGI